MLKYYFCQFALGGIGVGTTTGGAIGGLRRGWTLSAADPITTAVDHHDGVAVVSIGGEIDLSTAPAFEAAIDGALDNDPQVLVIDVSEVSFMASVGLRILAATHEKVGKSAHIAIVANTPATSRPMQLTGLDKVLALYPTLDDALTAVGTGSN